MRVCACARICVYRGAMAAAEGIRCGCARMPASELQHDSTRQEAAGSRMSRVSRMLRVSKMPRMSRMSRMSRRKPPRAVRAVCRLGARSSAEGGCRSGRRAGGRAGELWGWRSGDRLLLCWGERCRGGGGWVGGRGGEWSEWSGGVESPRHILPSYIIRE